MKSAVFERQHGATASALSIVKEALTKFPKFPKLYMIQGQILQSQGNIPAARAAYAAGVKACPKEVTLWILSSRLEEADNKSIKARSLLERARLVNPANEDLWVEAVGVEERSGASGQAKTLIARGLQECPASGALWSLAIWAEPRPQRKSRSADALKKTSDNPILICAVARLFWAESKIEKAREWFARAVKPINKNAEPIVSVSASERPAIDGSLIGDTWGWFLKFEEQHGTQVRYCFF
jgi:pre-mRNA-processing factor 6